jgi:hypothetical protein
LLSDLTPDIAPAPPPERSLPFRRPADYYSSPERVPVLPRGVPYGCGSASILFLLLIFSAGAFVSEGRGGALMEMMFAKLQSEIDGQFTKDVPTEQRAAFDTEFNRLRARVKTQKADFTRLQPLLRKITETTSDNKVTPDEAKQLTDALRDANR